MKNFTIDFNTTLKENILGVGTEWDPPMYDCVPDFTDEQWNLIFKRLDFFKLKFTRIMHYSLLAAPGDTLNDYEGRRAKNVLRALEYCQSRGVVVMLGMWNKPHWIKTYDDPVFIRSVADWLIYLREEKKLDCIRYFNFVNEPNGEWEIPNDNWAKWKAGVTALHKEFKERGILKHMSICGPDSAYDDEWVDMCAAAIPDIIGEYEYHIYIHDKTEITGNRLENRIKHKRASVNKVDPAGKQKRLWLGEFGCRDGKWDQSVDAQNSVYDHIYGTWIADAVCQTFRAGLDGIIPWNMDDAAHPGGEIGVMNGTFKRWGFWNSYGGQEIAGTESSTVYPVEDRNLRPWFYPMSLFSRLFQGGGDIVDTGPAQEGVKVCAYRSKDRTNVSIAIINAEDEKATVTLTLKGIVPESLTKYHYFEGDMPTDADGFAVPKEKADELHCKGAG